MTITLVWGKEFKFENTALSDGKVYEELFGVEGGSEGIAATSVREVMAVAAKYGVSVDLWPVYPDCQVDKDVPLDDVRACSEIT